MDLSLSMHRWFPLLGCVLAAGALATSAVLAGAHPLAPPAGAEAVPVAVEAAGTRQAAITIDNFTFAPPVIIVAAGTRIAWANRDDIPHTFAGVEDPRALRSPPLDTDDQFAFTFAIPGTYRHFCSPHSPMQGMVVVR